ncbi:MAG: hypothetical protein R3C52_00965 [Hyphomonadaceae bacterium]
MSAMLIAAVLFASGPQEAPAADAAPPPAAAEQPVKAEKPKRKCRMEPVTGSRARLQRVCTDDQLAEDTRKAVTNMQNATSSMRLPSSAGGG